MSAIRATLPLVRGNDERSSRLDNITPTRPQDFREINHKPHEDEQEMTKGEIERQNEAFSLLAQNQGELARAVTALVSMQGQAHSKPPMSILDKVKAATLVGGLLTFGVGVVRYDSARENTTVTTAAHVEAIMKRLDDRDRIYEREWRLEQEYKRKLNLALEKRGIPSPDYVSSPPTRGGSQ